MTPYIINLAIAGSVNLLEIMGTLLCETLLANGHPDVDNLEALLTMQVVGGVANSPFNALLMTGAFHITDSSRYPGSSPFVWSVVAAGGLTSILLQANLGKYILEELGQALNQPLLKPYTPSYFLSLQDNLLLDDGFGILGAIILLVVAYSASQILKSVCKLSKPQQAEAPVMLRRPLIDDVVDIGILSPQNDIPPPGDNMPTASAIQAVGGSGESIHVYPRRYSQNV